MKSIPQHVRVTLIAVICLIIMIAIKMRFERAAQRRPPAQQENPKRP